MNIPFFIYSASTGALLEGVVATFAYYRRHNEDDTITTLTPPAIADRGGGFYEFDITDADLTAGSSINYVIDCTVAAASRYLEDHVDSDAVAAQEAVEAGDGVVLFGVTAATLRAHCFPRLDSFSTTTSPTETTVTEKIEVAASRLAAGLAKEEISPSSILTDTPAYAICADIIRKAAALDCRIPADDPETPKGWAADVKAFYALLEVDAGVALADADLVAADSEPDGPTHHIDEYDLSIGDTDDASSAAPALRKDDSL